MSDAAAKAQANLTKGFFTEFSALATIDRMDVYKAMVNDLESPCQENMQEFVADETNCRILHAVEGVASEAGEQVDQIKKAMAYGKKLDYVNMDEEMGDVLWYLQLYCNARGIGLTQLMAQNYSKLRTRYGDKFSKEACFNRDLNVERKDLEQSTKSFRVQHDYQEGLPQTNLDAQGTEGGKVTLATKN